MPRVKRKTKAENLARVRHNQHKCRQRRRDYVAELESRIASCESAAAQANLRLQTTEEQLRRENQILRGLLSSSGVNSSILDQYLAEGHPQEALDKMQSELDLVGNAESSTDSRTGPTPLQSLKSIPYFQSLPEETDSVGPVTDPEWGQGLLPSPSRAFDVSFGFNMQNFHVPSLLETESGLDLSKHSLLTGQDMSGNISDVVLQDTTVCAVAFQLVIQCNRRNVDILEIDQRMCHGYWYGRTPYEGCRIDNWVLLDVLADIVK